MAAERNYLAAIRAMELQTAAGFDDARRILSSWEPELEHEVELQLRFSLLLQQAYVLSEMFDEARETELRIERKLHARARYDLDAAVLVQVQNRRASAVTVPEVAEAVIRESVSFFRRGTKDVVRDSLELYRSLNNLAACQLRLGKDGEALLNAGEAERIAVDTPDLVHRLDVLASNAVVAGYRSDAVTLDDALARQRLVIESPEGGDDKFIHRCNLVAFLLLASLDDEAADELERLGHELHANEFAETYLIFYWSALRVTLAAVRGDIEDSLAKHAEMDAFAASIRWPTAPYVRRRQVLLRAALASFDPASDRVAVDRLLLDAYPSEIGPAWPYYGRLMPCAELSFWSDS
jgi:hypothetical protein